MNIFPIGVRRLASIFDDGFLLGISIFLGFLSSTMMKWKKLSVSILSGSSLLNLRDRQYTTNEGEN